MAYGRSIAPASPPRTSADDVGTDESHESAFAKAMADERRKVKKLKPPTSRGFL